MGYYKFHSTTEKLMIDKSNVFGFKEWCIRVVTLPKQ